MSVSALKVTEDEAGMRLDRWFKRRVPELSLSHLNKIVRTGQVRVDGARVKTATRLEAGQTVRVPPLKLEAPMAPRPAVHAASPEDLRALREMILFEDRDLMVLNKPYGLAVQGGSGMTRHVDGMLASMANENGDRPVLVHRLDRDTSGVLLVAKTRRMAADLGEIFRSRQARKIYWALVKASRNQRRDAFRCSSPRATGWAMSGTSATRESQRPWVLRRCASPNTATKMRNIRSPIMRPSIKLQRASHGCR